MCLLILHGHPILIGAEALSISRTIVSLKSLRHGRSPVDRGGAVQHLHLPFLCFCSASIVLQGWSLRPGIFLATFWQDSGISAHIKVFAKIIDKYFYMCYTDIVRGYSMKSYSSKEVIAMLKADGWYEVNVVGSHHQYKHPTKKAAQL